MKYGILVVDDEIPIREWIAICLHRALGDKVRVDTADNGKNAWDKFQSDNYSIVITDINMPVMNGIELVRQIYETAPATTIIVLTGYEDFKYARSFIKYHIYDYILKSEISNEYLVEIIKGCMSLTGANAQRSETSGGSSAESAALQSCPQDALDRIYQITAPLFQQIATVTTESAEQIASAVDDLFAYAAQYPNLHLDVLKNVSAKLCEAAYLGTHTKNSHYLYESMVIQQELSCIDDAYHLRDYLYARLLPSSSEMPKSTRNKAIQQAVEYIDAHYNTISRLSDVAKQVFLSPEYFSRLFKEELGINFSIYLNNCRLSHAITLLQQPEMKVYEIAEAVGFSSLSYFSQIFKKKYGINPFTFRTNLMAGIHDQTAEEQ